MEQKTRIKAHIGLCIVVCIWGFDYVPAKMGLDILSPMCLLFCKYIQGFAVMLIIKLVTKNGARVMLKDIPKFILCSLFGEILYFNCEYNAMDYMPVSLITILLAFVPVFTVLIDWLVFKKKPRPAIIAGIFVCIAGVCLIIGVDIEEIISGRLFGYLLCFGAILSWNVYNFLTSSLREYDSVTLTCTQMICTMLLILPVVIHSFPSPDQFTPQIAAGLLWLGIIDAGLGFLMMVNGLKVLGQTISAVYSNFMPVTATFCSFVFLHETITPLQILGGVIVVASGFFVIRENGKLTEM